MAPTDLPPPGFLEKEKDPNAVDNTGLPPPGFLKDATIQNPPSRWDQAMEYLNLNPWSPKGSTMVPDEEGNLVQQPGLKRIGANVTELAGSVLGGIGGAAVGTGGGAVAGMGVAGPAGALPGAGVGGYVGAAAGSTAGYEVANSLARLIGLRPEDSKGDTLRDMEGNFVANLAAPPILKGLGATASAAARPLANSLRLSSDRLASFLNVPKNLARSMSDTLGDYEQPFTDQLQKIPEVFAPVKSGVVSPGEAQAAGMHDISGQLSNPGMKWENNPLSPQRGRENIFAKISENVDKIKQFWGPKIDGVLEQLPNKIKVKDLGIQDLENSLKTVDPDSGKPLLAGIRSKATADVALSETEALAKQLLPEAEQVHLNAAIGIVRKAKNLLGEADIVDAPLPPGFEETARKAQGVIDGYRQYMGDFELSPTQVRSLKTQWGANARFDRATTPDAFESSRANVYGELAGKLRDTLNTAVDNSALPDTQKQLFKTANDKYSILSQVGPTIADRAQWANQMGQASKTGAFRAHEDAGSGVGWLGRGVEFIPGLGKLIDVFKSHRPAEDNVPFARLERGLGLRPHPLLAGLQIGEDVGHSALRGVQSAGDFMSANAFASPLGGAMPPTGPLLPNALGAGAGIGRGLYEQASSLTSPQSAQAQGPLTGGPVQGIPPQMPMPRSSVITNQNPQAFTMRAAAMAGQQAMQMTGDPMAAQAIAQKTAQETAHVIQTGNPEDKEAMYHAMAKMLPGLFQQTPGAYPSELDGKIDAELDGPTLMDAVLHGMNSGALNSIQAAQQIQELNTKKISRVMYRPGVPAPIEQKRQQHEDMADSLMTPAGQRQPSY